MADPDEVVGRGGCRSRGLTGDQAGLVVTGERRGVFEVEKVWQLFRWIQARRAELGRPQTRGASGPEAKQRLVAKPLALFRSHSTKVTKRLLRSSRTSASTAPRSLGSENQLETASIGRFGRVVNHTRLVGSAPVQHPCVLAREVCRTAVCGKSARTVGGGGAGRGSHGGIFRHCLPKEAAPAMA